MTASHFATEFYPVQPDDVALVNAAAGGAGLLLTLIIKLKGGQVIGRVSSADKAAVAKEAGADYVIVDTEGRFAEGRFAEEAVRLSGGEGVSGTMAGSIRFDGRLMTTPSDPSQRVRERHERRVECDWRVRGK